jgi:hypothetical protein
MRPFASICGARETTPDGLMQDEYTPREWATPSGDRLIARQPRCSGEVGMIGLSWSGFNGSDRRLGAPL